ncbi:hypothetical protein LCGC14_1830570 [marine sediment metagenome]|uniref:Uncharacterized protein n=1 Tax=marine sediment metagenome TaxID=412755 RepID=A0A0F9GGI0_9ZZZZ
MPTRIITGDYSGSRIYTIGRVGYDSAGDDEGGVFTASLRSERFSPAGEGGLVTFRRIQARIWHTGAFSGIMKAFIDGVQTQIFSSGALVDQSVAFSASAPTEVGSDGGAETIIEMDVGVLPDVNGNSKGSSGTYIEVEISVDSDDVTGIFLPESFWIGHRVIRAGLQRSALSS